MVTGGATRTCLVVRDGTVYERIIDKISKVENIDKKTCDGFYTYVNLYENLYLN